MFSIQPDDIVFDKQLYVFAFNSRGAFCVLQSRPHEVWSLFFGSSFEDRPIYTLGDCFDAFPFPYDYIVDAKLAEAGEAYETWRAKVMRDSSEGLTHTYNRFHDPHEKSSEIQQLRELHEAMDRAVLEAYGWDDLAQTARCEFLLDYEEEDEDGGVGDQGSGGRKRRKKKPWRLRWPDEFRDEVLARLLELNEQRHQEELLAGKLADKEKKNSKPKTKRVTKKEQTDSSQTKMF